MDRIGNGKTNRTQLKNDPPVGDQDTLDTVRLRVVQTDNITHGQTTSRHLVERHDTSVGRPISGRITVALRDQQPRIAVQVTVVIEQDLLRGRALRSIVLLITSAERVVLAGL